MRRVALGWFGIRRLGHLARHGPILTLVNPLLVALKCPHPVLSTRLHRTDDSEEIPVPYEVPDSVVRRQDLAYRDTNVQV
ncbi:hypothetical protein SDC9_212966 [bioreactor metagenome]|uniref:Uncharacterized protein n=1 Tax=bioreactor metagenome TaxID=1076179 RepID=A0A645JPD8_9ZZZZ